MSSPSPSPPIPSLIHTPRLTLLRLTNTTPGSTHVQLFHENYTDADTMAWSLRGPTHSLEESRDVMIEHLTKYDNLFYSVFAKRDGDESQDGMTEAEIPGVHVGSVSLRLQLAGPSLPPPPPADERDGGKPMNMRVIGYAYFKQHWGKGYASEAGRALVDAYAASVAEAKAKGEQVYYIEAGADEGNPGSLNVLRKLGFEKVGWKDDSGPVWLNGEWRSGYWILGMYV